MTSLISDVRFAFRSLSRRPAVTAVAVASLGLGIAAVASVWIAADAVLLRPLPYDPNNELVLVGTRVNGFGDASSPSSVPDFLELRDRARGMDVAGYRSGGVNLGGEPVEWVSARRVSAGFFRVVGVSPAMGRGILSRDETPGSPEVVVLGHALWERRFGSDPDILGRTVTVDGVSATVVGVLPSGFEFGWRSPSLWLPLRVSPAESRSERSISIVARVDGGDIDRAREELSALSRTLAETGPSTDGERTFVAARARDEWYGGAAYQQGAAAAVTGTLLVLLIACANVANLLLARGTDRASEIAVRRALGASRPRVIRELMVEALVLAAVGGIVGVVGASVALPALIELAPSGLPRLHTIRIDSRALLLTTGIVCLTALVFGLLPAFRTLQGGTRARLAEGATSGTGTERGRLRSALVAVEVCLALVLLATTGLVLRSVDTIRSVDTGYKTDGSISFALDLPESRYADDARSRQVVRNLHDELVSLPGVTAAGLSAGLPGRDWRSLPYRLPEDAADGEESRRFVLTRFVSPGWLEAVGVELLAGRRITRSDDSSGPDVILVNESFADEHWPDEAPLGRTIRVRERTLEVVGVVPDVHEMGPVFPAPRAIYAPLQQWPDRSVDVVMRSQAGITATVRGGREAIARVAPDVALHAVAPLDDVLESSAGQFVAMGTLLSALTAVAVFLAVVGVYASMAYSVARRIPEIGVRMALGADRTSVRRMILRRAVIVSLVGLAAGLSIAAVAAQGLSAFIFGVDAGDPVALTAAAGLILAVSLAAAWIPARRASSVDPMVALRSR